MNANELRVGNKVSLYGSIATIIPNDFQKWFQNEPNWESKAFKGIELTEEWLGKFHWFGVREGNYVFDDINYFSISVDGFLYFNDTPTATTIEYVHQLQNLYFALTGEELTTDK